MSRRTETDDRSRLARDYGGQKRAQMWKPISRILSREEVALLAWMIISLGFESPRTSSGLPEDLDRASRCARHARRLTDVFLFGLAPGDAYHAGDVATTAVGSYPAVSPLPEPRRPDGIPSRRPSAVWFLWCWCRIAPPGSYPAPFLPMPKHRAITQPSHPRTYSIKKSDRPWQERTRADHTSD